MKIGIITHNYPLESTERKDAGIFLYDFAHELAKNHQVFVLCPNFEGKKEDYTTVPVTWFSWRGGKQKLGAFKPLSLNSWLNLISLLRDGRRAAVDFARQNQLDVCLAAWVFPAGVLAQAVVEEVKIPFATWALGSDINQYAKLPLLGIVVQRVLKSAQWRFANSLALCKKVELLSRRDCILLPAVTTFEVALTPKKMLEKDKVNFLFVGRLEKVKGIDILLKAVAQLRCTIADFKLWVIGDGSLEEDLKKFADKHGLTNWVTFCGRGDKTMVASFMKGADCLIIPSRSESLPLVMLEAARVELPIIATNVGDCAAMINKYNIGIVAKVEDPEDLAFKMQRFMAEQRLEYIERGFRQIQADFSQQAVVSQFIAKVAKY